MIFLLVFVLAGAALVGAIIGYGSANGRDVPAPGTNSTDGACKDKCEQVQARRSEVCTLAAIARAAEAEARRAEAAHTAAVTVFAVLAAIAAAAWAVTLIVITAPVSVPIAIGATIAAGVAAAAEVTALAAMLGAQAAAGRASSAEALARRREQEAITLMRQSCPANEVDACLARPRPC
jgi:hypothetical protein